MNGWRRRRDAFHAPLSACDSIAVDNAPQEIPPGVCPVSVSAVFLLAARRNKVPSAVYGSVFNAFCICAEC